MERWLAAFLVGAATFSAQAQGAAAGQPGSGDPLPSAETCIAILDGQAPAGVDVSRLRSQCAAMLRRAEVTPGSDTRQPAQGRSALAGFEQAGNELIGRGDAPVGGFGRTTRGEARSLLTTNPIGWFSGLGVNATYSRALEDFSKLSWLASARYARANASNGNITTVGLGAGADLFVIGRTNEGLRIGPRLDLSFGTESIGGTTSYARLGLSGELGYNFIASNGISALAAVGFGGRIAGDSQNENFTSFTGGELGPYLKLGIGYAF